jgi:hypothetical protein
MMAVLLGVGIGLVVAGLAALGYGILIKDFSFGNALIVAGAVAACSGLIMFGLWVVARELQDIARRLGAGIGIAPQAGSALAPAVALPRSEPGTLPFGRDQAAAESTPAAEPTPPPWPMEAAATAVPPPPAEAPPEQKQKRNLLFSSSSRKERERATARTSEPLAPDLLSPDLRPPPSVAPPSAPAPEPDKPPPTFEDAWPKPERPRPGDALRRGRAPQPAPESSVPPPAPREPAPQVTVLKSGVVDGMAYSLYSDGSIEAQMPEGMMRFASIDELRAHLDQRS